MLGSRGVVNFGYIYMCPVLLIMFTIVVFLAFSYPQTCTQARVVYTLMPILSMPAIPGYML